METRRRRQHHSPVRQRISPPRRPHRVVLDSPVRTAGVQPPSPPPSPPPQPSPSQAGSLEHTPENSPAPEQQPAVTQEQWRHLMRSIGNIQQRNEHLQAQLDFYRRDQRDDGGREADSVAEFRPFSEDVESVAIPDNMKTLVLDSYSGDSDPKDHLLYFNTKMVIIAASDAVKCRMFPSTFKSTAMAWFTTLPRGSISNFRDFSSKFLVQFSANKNQPVTINDLYNIRQQEGESLKEYMARYSAASVKVEDEEPRACALAFKNGLLPGGLNSKLTRKPARSMEEMRARASTYILDEEDDAFKRKRAKLEKGDTSPKRAKKDKYGEDKGDGKRQREDKGKVVLKPTKEQLYPRRDDYEQRRPWQSKSHRQREEADMVMNTDLTDMLREARDAHLVDELEAPKYQPRDANPKK